MLESKQLYLEKIHTSENGSDMLTKCLPKEKLEEACGGEICWVRPFVWAGPMGKAHCLNKNKIKEKKSQKGELLVVRVAAKK